MTEHSRKVEVPKLRPEQVEGIIALHKLKPIYSTKILVLYAIWAALGWAMLTYQHYEAGIESMAGRVAMVVRRLLLGQTDPQGLSYLTLGSATRIPMEWALLPAGALMAGLSGFVRFRKGSAVGATPARLTILAWWLVSLAAIAAWLPHDWERYYLPALPPAIILVSGALAALLSRGLKIAREAIGQARQER